MENKETTTENHENKDLASKSTFKNNEKTRLILIIIATAIISAILTVAINNYIQKPTALWQQSPGNQQSKPVNQEIPAEKPFQVNPQNNPPLNPAVNSPQAINSQKEQQTYDLALPGGGNAHFIFPSGWKINDTDNEITLVSPDGDSTYKISKNNLANGRTMIFNSSSTRANQAYSINVTASGNQTTVKISDNPNDLMMMRNYYRRNAANLLLEMEKMHRAMDEMFWNFDNF